VLFQDTVLTAAHCCADNIAYDLQIVAGEHDLSWNDGPAQFRNIARIIKHGAYNPLTLDNDTLCHPRARDRNERSEWRPEGGYRGPRGR
jgi:secreted trypsin-like serine protease